MSTQVYEVAEYVDYNVIVWLTANNMIQVQQWLRQQKNKDGLLVEVVNPKTGSRTRVGTAAEVLRQTYQERWTHDQGA